MKILLIYPGSGFPEMPPLGLMSLAAYMEKEGHEILLSNGDEMDQIERFLLYFKPDIIGITSTTNMMGRSYQVARSLMSRGYFVVMGGPHVSALPNEALNYCNAVVIGEGEKIFADIAKLQVPGIYEGVPITNLDELPYPAYHLINTEIYARVANRIHISLFSYVPVGHRALSQLNSRGCPYKCIFCYNSGRSTAVRYMSPERVVAELKWLVNTYKLNTVHFHDDDFMFNKGRLEKILGLMKEEKINIYWSANCRSTDITQDKLELATQYNCAQLAFGFESGSDRIQEVLNKKQTIVDIKSAVELCDKNGVVCQASFMVGNPTETIEEIQATESIAKNYMIDGGLGAAVCTPYPGTKLWSWCIEKGIIKEGMNINWNDFNYDTINWKLADIDMDVFKNRFQYTRTLFGRLFESRENSRISKVNKIIKHIKENPW